MREVLKTAAAVLTFAAVMSLLTATARGAGDPPRLETPDPPRLEKRVSDLEREVAALKAVVYGGAAVPTVPAPTARAYPLGQSFTADSGVTYTLGADGHYREAARVAPVVTAAASWGQTAGRQPTGHTHTCANGHTWDHATHAGHDCPVCGLSQYTQDARPRPVTVGQTRAASQPAAAVKTYTIGASASGCANGACETTDFRDRKKLFGR